MTATDFFDTNVLFYLLSADAAKAERAEQLVAAGGVISVQVLNEFAATAARKLAMRVAEIRVILSTLRELCAVKPLDVTTHEFGLDLAERYRYSIYDAMIVAAALRADCSTLYSEDLRHGQKIERLMILNPFRSA
jgi:predicted nucleic acid-binding protein